MINVENYVFVLRVINIIFVLILLRYFYIALAARKQGRRITGITRTIFLYILFDAIFAVSVILPISNLRAVMWTHLGTETAAVIGKLTIIIYSVFPHERQIICNFVCKWFVKHSSILSKYFGGIQS